MTKQSVRARIEEIGIIPAVRVCSPEEAIFAAEAVRRGGIPIVEITMTVPGAMDVISCLVKHSPDMVVGAGDVFDMETARACRDAGAAFLTSPGLDTKIVEFAAKEDLVAIPGALTPTEVIAAWKSGADFVKVFPCAQVGGASYIKALKAPFPQIEMIPTGGVNLETAGDFLKAGACAVAVGGELVDAKLIREGRFDAIEEKARHYLAAIAKARGEIEAAAC
jgi:2-dehydro-3-deoxyphosphogluconate aldolase / (4S)-4-hydroxy-2-oxoglutarate aldolase